MLVQDFQSITNLQSEFNESVIGAMASKPLHWDLENAPTEGRTCLSLETPELKLGKVGKRGGQIGRGRKGLRPELIAFGGLVLLTRSLHIVKAVWEDWSVASDRKDPEVVH